MRKCGLWLLLFYSLLLSQPISEERVKAVFVEKFAQFTEWPETLNDDSLLVIAIQGESGVSMELVEFLHNSSKKSNYKIVLLGIDDSIPFCHLLFIAHRNEKRLHKTLESLESNPVLTISDARGFAEEGVMINLYTEHKKVRFEINKDALDRASVVISYKVLNMAKIVKDKK